MLRLERLPTGEYGTNCYLLACPETGQAALIDPGDDPEEILALCATVQVAHILLTHGHWDHHLRALGQVREALGVPVGVHPADATAFEIAADFDLVDGMTLAVGKHQLEVVHIPGHTPGSVAFRFDKRAVVGDAVFPGGPGASASPEALEILLLSLQRTVFAWPDETLFYPGHGDGAAVGQVRAPFQAFLARPRPADLCGDVTWD